jgi:superfamily II DNA/RNA helicase
MSHAKLDIPNILNKLGFKGLKPLQEELLQTSEKYSNTLLLAPTGSGKTLAFLLPVLRNLQKDIDEVQCLILAPTRELALQIEKVFRAMQTGHKVLSCYGGHSFSRERQSLKHPPAVLVATPGRLLDHMQRKTFQSRGIKTLVLDEYDKSLEMGFSKEMQSIIRLLPQTKQHILTSATRMDSLPDFLNLDKLKTIDYLNENLQPNLSFYVVESSWQEKLAKLASLLRNFDRESSIVFCNFKKDIEAISDFLYDEQIPHSLFFGDLDQQEREKSLLKFRNGSNHVLLATDLAARGLDIPEIKNIVHFQIPGKEDVFTHRNGRTARMNKNGKVFLMLTEGKELPDYLHEKIIPFTPEKSESNIQAPTFSTLYISAGRQQKVSKGDVLGFVCKIGELDMKHVGLIEIKDTSSYVAVHTSLAEYVITKCNGQRLKKGKVRVEFA